MAAAETAGLPNPRGTKNAPILAKKCPSVQKLKRKKHFENRVFLNFLHFYKQVKWPTNKKCHFSEKGTRNALLATSNNELRFFFHTKNLFPRAKPPSRPPTPTTHLRNIYFSLSPHHDLFFFPPALFSSALWYSIIAIMSTDSVTTS